LHLILLTAVIKKKKTTRTENAASGFAKRKENRYVKGIPAQQVSIYEGI